MFLRTPPIDQVLDGGEVKLLCCFRQPLKRRTSCGSAESSNQPSSSDDREQTPMCEDATVLQAMKDLTLPISHVGLGDNDTVNPITQVQTPSTLSYRIKYPSIKNKGT